VDLPASVDDEETVLAVLRGLRDFCAANMLHTFHQIIEDCLKECQDLYVEKRRREFRDKDADAT
jgi:predicted DNA-binding WGR domain protein